MTKKGHRVKQKPCWGVLSMVWCLYFVCQHHAHGILMLVIICSLYFAFSLLCSSNNVTILMKYFQEKFNIPYRNYRCNLLSKYQGIYLYNTFKLQICKNSYIWTCQNFTLESNNFLSNLENSITISNRYILKNLLILLFCKSIKTFFAIFIRLIKAFSEDISALKKILTSLFIFCSLEISILKTLTMTFDTFTYHIFIIFNFQHQIIQIEDLILEKIVVNVSIFEIQKLSFYCIFRFIQKVLLLNLIFNSVSDKLYKPYDLPTKKFKNRQTTESNTDLTELNMDIEERTLVDNSNKTLIVSVSNDTAISDTNNKSDLNNGLNSNSFITSNDNEGTINSNSYTDSGVLSYYYFINLLVSNNHLINHKKWDKIFNNMDEGRLYMAKVWKELNLNRTANFIVDKLSCSIQTLRKLYDRFEYLSKNDFLFQDTNPDDNNNTNLEIKYDEDKIIFEEAELQSSKEIYYAIFEGSSYKQLDEFGALLFSVINYEIISEDFQIRSLGADRFIVGFNVSPPFDILNRKLQDYKIFLTPYSKLKELLNVPKENTGGIIYFINNKLISYVDIQIAIAKLKVEIKTEIKRIHLRKDMFILFVPLEKLTALVSQLKYLNINNIIFRSTCNLNPEYNNNTAKLILENSPLNSSLRVRIFLTKMLLIEEQYIDKIYQFRKANNSRLAKNTPAFLIWIRGEQNIKKILLSVVDYFSDKKRVGFFKWPKSKENMHPILTNDLLS